MRTFTLQLHDVNGTVEEEKEIVLGEHDTLVMQYPDDMHRDEAFQNFKGLTRGIETGGVVGLVNTITLTVVKKEVN